jgi:hypothetical protein
MRSNRRLKGGAPQVGSRRAPQPVVRHDEPPQRLRVDVDLPLARDQRDDLRHRAARVVHQVLGDRAGMLRLVLRDPEVRQR